MQDVPALSQHFIGRAVAQCRALNKGTMLRAPRVPVQALCRKSSADNLHTVTSRLAPNTSHPLTTPHTE